MLIASFRETMYITTVRMGLEVDMVSPYLVVGIDQSLVATSVRMMDQPRRMALTLAVTATS